MMSARLELELKLKAKYEFLENVDVGGLVSSIENVLSIAVDTLLKYPMTEEGYEGDFRPVEQVVNGAANLIRGILATREREVRNAPRSFAAILVDQVCKKMEGEEGIPFFARGKNCCGICELMDNMIYEHIRKRNFERANLFVENLGFLFQRVFCEECEGWLEEIGGVEDEIVSEKLSSRAVQANQTKQIEKPSIRKPKSKQSSHTKLLEDTFSCIRKSWIGEDTLRAVLGGLALALVFNERDTVEVLESNEYSEYLREEGDEEYWRVFCRFLIERKDIALEIKERMDFPDYLWTLLNKSAREYSKSWTWE